MLAVKGVSFGTVVQSEPLKIAQRTEMNIDNFFPLKNMI